MAGSATGRWTLTSSPRSILILKPSSFGDIVHTLPAVALLRRRWPEARISWLVNPEWSPLLLGNPLVDETVLFPRGEFRGWKGMAKSLGWLRREIRWRQPDLAVDYQGLLRTAVIGRLSGAKKLFGIADAREGARWIYDEVAPIPEGKLHAVERYLALSKKVLGNDREDIPAQAARENSSCPLPEGEPIAAAELEEGSYILLHPFARGGAKSLSITQVQALCACLAPRRVLIVGRHPNPDLTLPRNGINLLNRTSIPQLLWLIQRSDFVLSVDSGPVHLAAALGKPLVSIHTWSDPRRVGPYRADAWVVKNGELMQVNTLGFRPESFYSQTATEILPPRVLEAVCLLATSS